MSWEGVAVLHRDVVQAMVFKQGPKHFNLKSGFTAFYPFLGRLFFFTVFLSMCCLRWRVLLHHLAYHHLAYRRITRDYRSLFYFSSCYLLQQFVISFI